MSRVTEHLKNIPKSGGSLQSSGPICQDCKSEEKGMGTLNTKESDLGNPPKIVQGMRKGAEPL